jgi:hypothetical protein
MVSVELRPAYVWTCDNCGRDQYETAVVYELSEEERQELKAEHGVDADAEGDFLACPVEVTCRACGALFDCRHFSDEIE